MIFLIHFLGSVALLLWGLRMVKTGILRAYGPQLSHILGKMLSNRFAALGGGLAITCLLQSSSATSLLISGFTSRGLVSGGSALAVMLGADVGTSLVAQAYSFRVDWISPALIFIGWAMFTKIKQSQGHDLGRAIVGLGLTLLGLHMIAGLSAPLGQSAVLATILPLLVNAPLAGLIIGAGLTALATSSLAVILLIVSFMQAGMVPLPLGLAMVLGANLGSAFLPILATLRDSPEIRRTPWGNALFRIIGCILFLPLLPYLSPYLARIHEPLWRQALDFHVLFNVSLAVGFLPIVYPLARALERFLPNRPEDADPSRPRYLKPDAEPDHAIANAARETLRLGDLVGDMLRQSLHVFRSDDRRLIGKVSEIDNQVDHLNREIKLYLANIGRQCKDENQRRRIRDLIMLTTNLEHIGDIIDKGLMSLAAKKLKYRLQFSAEGSADLVNIHERLTHNLELALNTFMSGDLKLARRLFDEKKKFRLLEREAAAQHLERLQSGRVESIKTSALHLDILRDLKRVNTHLTSIAQQLLEEAGELNPSRLKEQI